MENPHKVDTKLCDFSSLVEKDYYIDKTDLLSNIFDLELVKMLLKAPPGFGKTTILSMIKTFSEVAANEDGVIMDEIASRRQSVFTKRQLEINKQSHMFDRHFAKYPVLSLSFKNFTQCDSLREAYMALNKFVCDAVNSYDYLRNSDKLSLLDKQTYHRHKKLIPSETYLSDDLVKVLAFLKECLFKHYNQKVLILIDDYDIPIISTANIDGNPLVTMINSIIRSLTEDVSSLKGYVIAGMRFDYLNLSQELTENLNAEEFFSTNFLYGLLESEVDLIFSKYNIDTETAGTVKAFYTSYSKNGLEIYSPWSILSFLQFRKLKNYWLHSPRVDSGIESYEIIYSLKTLINNIPYDLKYKKLISALDYKKKDFFKYVLGLGYASFQTPELGNIHLTIPDENLPIIYDDERQFYRPTQDLAIYRCTKLLTRMTLPGYLRDYKQFLAAFKNACQFYDRKIFAEHIELYYFLLYIIATKTKYFYSTAYKILRPSPDLLIVVKNRTILYFLVKYINKDCFKTALQKILEERYYENRYLSPELHRDNKILIGINIGEFISNSKVTLDVLCNSYSIDDSHHCDVA